MAKKNAVGDLLWFTQSPLASDSEWGISQYIVDILCKKIPAYLQARLRSLLANAQGGVLRMCDTSDYYGTDRHNAACTSLYGTCDFDSSSGGN
ncbi:MAG TPA: hypothetical protein VD927_19805 [Chryseosolibacter sp.]|nr:hypothetical protein [Chryseosolibacter sp.]